MRHFSNNDRVPGVGADTDISGAWEVKYTQCPLKKNALLWTTGDALP